jgi:hypothetical protein
VFDEFHVFFFNHMIPPELPGGETAGFDQSANPPLRNAEAFSYLSGREQNSVLHGESLYAETNYDAR